MEKKNSINESILPDLQSLTRLQRLSRNESEFGREIIKEIFEKAKTVLQYQNKKDSEILIIPLLFTVRKVSRNGIPHVPNPNEIDICWEVSSSVSDLVTCPDLIPGTSEEELAQTHKRVECVKLLDQLNNATNELHKYRIMFEMLYKGCINTPDLFHVIGQMKYA